MRFAANHWNLAELLSVNLNKKMHTDTVINKAITPNTIEDNLSRKVNANFMSQRLTTGEDKEKSSSESTIASKEMKRPVIFKSGGEQQPNADHQKEDIVFPSNRNTNDELP